MSVVTRVRDEVNRVGGDILDRVIIPHKRNTEIAKFKDPRRKAIYERIDLTEVQKKQIDDFFLENYGEKIPYTWHRHYTAFTGNFDVKYFPELLYIPEFERFMNPYPEYIRVFGDKNVLPCLAAVENVRTPVALLSATKGFLRDAERKGLSRQEAIGYFGDLGEVFIKPTVDSCSGEGCALLDLRGGKDKRSGKAAADLIGQWGKDFVVQKRIVCSEDVKDLHPNSCNTFRIITYRWKDDFRMMPVTMRIGRNSNYLDNAHAGGIFVGVTNEGKLLKTAYSEFGEKFTEHPDTGIVFENYKIAGYEKVLHSALKMHAAIPQVGVINWDFTIDEENEPVLIEANVFGGGIWVIEMAHGCGAFGENTEEVLRWMRKAKKMKQSERDCIAFGQD